MFESNIEGILKQIKRSGIENCLFKISGNQLLMIAEKYEEVERLNEAFERVIDRLQTYEDSLQNQRLLIGNDIYKDKEVLEGARKLLLQELAYNRAIGIIKEEVNNARSK